MIEVVEKVADISVRQSAALGTKHVAYVAQDAQDLDSVVAWDITTARFGPEGFSTASESW